MEFDEIMINFIKEKYVDEIATNKALCDVENIIKQYYKSLEKQLSEEINISNGKIKFNYDTTSDEVVRIDIEDNFLSFVKKNKKIEVIISNCSKKPFDIIEVKKSIQYTHKYEYIASGNYKVDKGLLNNYLEKAFKNIILS